MGTFKLSSFKTNNNASDPFRRHSIGGSPTVQKVQLLQGTGSPVHKVPKKSLILQPLDATQNQQVCSTLKKTISQLFIKRHLTDNFENWNQLSNEEIKKQFSQLENADQNEVLNAIFSIRDRQLLERVFDRYLSTTPHSNDKLKEILSKFITSEYLAKGDSIKQHRLITNCVQSPELFRELLTQDAQVGFVKTALKSEKTWKALPQKTKASLVKEIAKNPILLNKLMTHEKIILFKSLSSDLLTELFPEPKETFTNLLDIAINQNLWNKLNPEVKGKFVKVLIPAISAQLLLSENEKFLIKESASDPTIWGQLPEHLMIDILSCCTNQGLLDKSSPEQQLGILNTFRENQNLWDPALRDDFELLLGNYIDNPNIDIGNKTKMLNSYLNHPTAWRSLSQSTQEKFLKVHSPQLSNKATQLLLNSNKKIMLNGFLKLPKEWKSLSNEMKRFIVTPAIYSESYWKTCPNQTMLLGICFRFNELRESLPNNTQTMILKMSVDPDHFTKFPIQTQEKVIEVFIKEYDNKELPTDTMKIVMKVPKLRRVILDTETQKIVSELWDQLDLEKSPGVIFNLIKSINNKHIRKLIYAKYLEFSTITPSSWDSLSQEQKALLIEEASKLPEDVVNKLPIASRHKMLNSVDSLKEYYSKTEDVIRTIKKLIASANKSDLTKAKTLFDAKDFNNLFKLFNEIEDPTAHSLLFQDFTTTLSEDEIKVLIQGEGYIQFLQDLKDDNLKQFALGSLFSEIPKLKNDKIEKKIWVQIQNELTDDQIETSFKLIHETHVKQDALESYKQAHGEKEQSREPLSNESTDAPPLKALLNKLRKKVGPTFTNKAMAKIRRAKARLKKPKA